MAEELWSVRLPTGVIRRGTLDDLDAAFEAGHIDENVLVLAPNATTWQRLGALAGLDGDAPPAASAAPPSQPPMPMPQQPTPNSIRPMTTDLDDIDLPFDRPRSKAGMVIGVLAFAAVAAFGTVFAISRLAGPSAPTDPLPVTAALAAKPPAPSPEIAPPPVAEKPRLTEEQKQTVLANDARRAKEQDERKKSRDAAAAKDAARHRPKAPQIEFGPSKHKGGPSWCVHGDPLCTC